MLDIWTMSQRGPFVWTIPTKPPQSWRELGPADDSCVCLENAVVVCVSVVGGRLKKEMASEGGRGAGEVTTERE